MQRWAQVGTIGLSCLCSTLLGEYFPITYVRDEKISPTHSLLQEGASMEQEYIVHKNLGARVHCA